MSLDGVEWLPQIETGDEIELRKETGTGIGTGTATATELGTFRD